MRISNDRTPPICHPLTGFIPVGARQVRRSLPALDPGGYNFRIPGVQCGATPTPTDGRFVVSRNP